MKHPWIRIFLAGVAICLAACGSVAAQKKKADTGKNTSRAAVEVLEKYLALKPGERPVFSKEPFAVIPLTGEDATRPVQVTMTPALAVSWLMPRITDFQQQHPGVTLMLNPTAEVVDLTPGGIDVAIRFCDGTWPGMEVRPFLGVVLGFEEVADGAEVMGVALAGLGWQDVALHPRLHLRLHLR